MASGMKLVKEQKLLKGDPLSPTSEASLTVNSYKQFSTTNPKLFYFMSRLNKQQAAHHVAVSLLLTIKHNIGEQDFS